MRPPPAAGRERASRSRAAARSRPGVEGAQRPSAGSDTGRPRGARAARAERTPADSATESDGGLQGGRRAHDPREWSERQLTRSRAGPDLQLDAGTHGQLLGEEGEQLPLGEPAGVGQDDAYHVVGRGYRIVPPED